VLSTQPFRLASTKTLARVNVKPPLEVVVGDLIDALDIE